MAFTFFLKLPDQSDLKVAQGDQIKPGQIVAVYQRFKKTSVKTGQKELTCKLGEKIAEGEILAGRKSLFKKETVKAPVDGQIFSFDQERGVVIIKTPSEKRELLSPVRGTIEEVADKQITISLPEPTVLEAEIAGPQTIGPLLPAPESIFDLNSSYRQKIIYAEKISPALFKKACVIGIKGVILANSEDLSAPPTVATVTKANITAISKADNPSVIIDPKQKKIALFENET